jgi:hypothetical protein
MYKFIYHSFAYMLLLLLLLSWVISCLKYRMHSYFIPDIQFYVIGLYHLVHL